ncbi:hypothetical protein CRV24_000413 [Beauveria bassiana]|nr:hypothetical protein CRV24_000413 [Beauveria bassiana]KAH8721049.1 hypothetical protein HC256_001416 [Beauveria bassiana]
MVKFSLMLAITSAMLPVSVMADGECTKNSLYCGFLLIDGKGYTERQVAVAAQRYICRPEDSHTVRKGAKTQGTGKTIIVSKKVWVNHRGVVPFTYNALGVTLKREDV